MSETLIFNVVTKYTEAGRLPSHWMGHGCTLTDSRNRARYADSRRMNDNLFGMRCKLESARRKVVQSDRRPTVWLSGPRAGFADREIVSRISSAVRGETRATGGHRHVDSFLSSVVVNEKFIMLLGERQRELCVETIRVIQN